MGECFTAQLVMRSADGRSIFDAPGPLTAQTVHDFDLPEQRIAEIRTRIEALGFSIPAGNANTLSISGPRALFAEVFGMEVGAERGNIGVHATRIPEELTDEIADVFVPPAPELFP